MSPRRRSDINRGLPANTRVRGGKYSWRLPKQYRKPGDKAEYGLGRNRVYAIEQAIRAEQTMNLWLVTVRCYCHRDHPLETSFVRLIVDAPDSESAFRQGRDYAEDNAEIGPRWIGFEPIEASRVALPFEIRSSGLT